MSKKISSVAGMMERSSSEARTKLLGGCSILAILALTTIPPAALAREIGVTSAVRPQVHGTPPREETRILSVGVDLFANEVIRTGERGQTHLLFVDGSSLTVGPGAELTLDRFVYDPDTKTGDLVITASKGLMRFVGGRLSKTKPVIFKTPTAVIGIRGGVAMMQVGGDASPSSVTMLFGDEVFMESGGQRQTMTRPGFQLSEQPGGGVNVPRQATQQELTQQLQGLEEPVPGEDDGNLGNIAPAAGGGVSDQDVAETQLADLGSNNDPANVGGGPNTGGTAAFGADNAGDTANASQRQALDTQVGSTGSEGGDNGDDTSGNESGDTGSSNEIISTSFQGRLKRDASATIQGSNDGDPNNNLALSNVAISTGNFSAETAAGDVSLIFPDAPGTFDITSSQSWPFGSVTGSDMGVLNDEETFVVYHLIDSFEARSLLFAGVPTAEFPTTGITGYTLSDDFVRNADVPFIDPDVLPLVESHGNVSIAWDDSSAGAQRAVGGGLVVIDGAGASQTSGGFFIAGRVLGGDTTPDHIQASFFGQSQGGATVQPVFYGGGLATSDAGDGSDFFGNGPDAFVLESADVNANDAITGRGVSRVFEGVETDPAFFANSVARKSDTTFSAPRTTQTLNGFASGMEVVTNGGSVVSALGIRTQSNNPGNLSIITNAAQNTLAATFTMEDANERSVVYNFGGGDGTGAFIEDGRFYARSSSASGATVSGFSVDSRHGLATQDIAVFQNGFVPSGVSLCTCEHLVWGFWGAQRQQTSGSGNLANTQLATWVAGDLAAATDVTLPVQGNVVYNGHLIGNVVNGSDRYVAVGGIGLSFDFNGSNFDLNSVTVTNFDGVSYSSVAGSGGSSFSSNAYSSAGAGLTISNSGRSVTLTGAFFEGRGANQPPLATGGQGTISGNGYGAAFTYAAEKVTGSIPPR